MNDTLDDAVTILVEEPYSALLDRDHLRAVILRTLLAEGVAEAQLSLVVTGDEAVRALNKMYRGLDEVTDVLSFGAQAAQSGSPDEHFVSAPEAERYLGDIVIAYPYAAAQARAQGKPVPAELALLAVHGVLHLLGYDHATEEEEELMWARQAAILQTA